MADTFLSDAGIVASRVTVGLAETPLIAGAGSYLLKNATATDTVVLGPVGVLTTTGYGWAKADEGSITVDLKPGQKLSGICATTPQVVHVLRVR
jgi:hypothetical protein